jgi:hypothetical protein
MKKLILCASVVACLGVTIKIATAKEPTTNPSISAVSINDIEGYISQVYSQIDFKGSEKISFDAFAHAYRGYLNLRNSGKLNSSKPVLTVADFTLSSTQKRLWLIDLQNKTVLMNEYVAHGQGSGDEFAKAFSNTENSHQSSIGFYVTDDTYVGKHGTSLRLHGMDNGYNSAAYERAIVVHGADYVSPSFIAGQKRLGRSWGCPAVSQQAIGKVINYIKGGTCLFIYYPQKQYLASSSWINKKIERLPEDYMIRDMIDPSTVAMNSSKEVRYVYADNAQDLNPASPFYVSPEDRVKREMLLAMNLDFIEKVLP